MVRRCSAGVSPAALSAGTVRITHKADGIELYFPPWRTPGVALALGAFGVIATALPAIAIAALLPAALADAGGLMGAVLLASFVVPFALFGVACILLAAYKVCNALLVRVDERGIATWRMLFGVTIRRGGIERNELAGIEPHIPARHQSVFGSEPIYELVAFNRGRTRRLVVAESLRGEAEMNEVKARIEEAVTRAVPDATHEG